jgi:hypothetical protein
VPLALHRQEGRKAGPQLLRTRSNLDLPVGLDHAMAIPKADPRARADARAPICHVAAIETDSCPRCKAGHWLMVELELRDPAGPAALVPREGTNSAVPGPRRAHRMPGRPS